MGARAMLQGFPYRATKTAWWSLLLLAYATGTYVAHKLLTVHWLGPRESTAVVFERAPLLDNTLLFVHAATALPPLLIGAWEFVPRLRKGRWLKLHRWFGLVYVAGIFISSTTGLLMAVHSPHGWMARGGFSMLAIVWFTTTWFAYRTAVRRDIAAHRRWMIRSYAITLAVVTVRFLATPRLGMSPEQWYPLMTWICWVPNFLAAELYVRSTDFLGRIRAHPIATRAKSVRGRSHAALSTQRLPPEGAAGSRAAL